MEVVDKINYLLVEKNLSKKDFTKILQSLEPKLKSTGGIPSEQTIYGYLNGKREIKIELIPYIAEVLHVKEQELFEFDLEYASEFNYTRSKEVREIIELLRFLPTTKVIILKKQLKEYKALYEKEL